MALSNRQQGSYVRFPFTKENPASPAGSYGDPGKGGPQKELPPQGAEIDPPLRNGMFLSRIQ